MLIEHDAVAEAAVVPRPTRCAWPFPRPTWCSRRATRPRRETALAILRHAREHLPAYKRVRRLEFYELPKTISGKIRRVELRGARGRAASRAPTRRRPTASTATRTSPSCGSDLLVPRRPALRGDRPAGRGVQRPLPDVVRRGLHRLPRPRRAALPEADRVGGRRDGRALRARLRRLGALARRRPRRGRVRAAGDDELHARGSRCTGRRTRWPWSAATSTSSWSGTPTTGGWSKAPGIPEELAAALG